MSLLHHRHMCHWPLSHIWKIKKIAKYIKLGLNHWKTSTSLLWNAGGVSVRGAGTTPTHRGGAVSVYLLSILLSYSYFSDSYFITTSSPMTPSAVSLWQRGSVAGTYNAGGRDGGTRCLWDGRMQAGTERVSSAPLTSFNGLFRIQTLPGDSCCNYWG